MQGTSNNTVTPRAQTRPTTARPLPAVTAAATTRRGRPAGSMKHRANSPASECYPPGNWPASAIAAAWLQRQKQDVPGRVKPPRRQSTPYHAIAHACPQWAANEAGATKEATGERKAARSSRGVCVCPVLLRREREKGALWPARALRGAAAKQQGPRRRPRPPLSPTLPSQVRSGGETSRPPPKSGSRTRGQRAPYWFSASLSACRMILRTVPSLTPTTFAFKPAASHSLECGSSAKSASPAGEHRDSGGPLGANSCVRDSSSSLLPFPQLEAIARRCCGTACDKLRPIRMRCEHLIVCSSSRQSLYARRKREHNYY